jgi:hypothetical protein
MHPSPDTTVSGSDARRQEEQPQDHLAGDGRTPVPGLDAAGEPGCSHCYDGGCGDPLGCGETDRRAAGVAACPECGGKGIAREAQGSAWPFPCPACKGTGTTPGATS